MPPMLDDLYEKIDTRLIYPAFLAKHRSVLSDCAWELAYFCATSGYRTPDEQTTLYLKGRETPGAEATPERPLGKVVTHARALESDHQFGIAIDCTRDAALDRAGLQPDWNIDSYEPMARNAKKHSLVSLFWSTKFREGPHVSLDLAAKGLSIAQLRTEYKRASNDRDGLKRAWRLLDSRGPW